ncbi:MAG: hypothetical protein R3E89_06565 [Thiolinea sp.]
MQLTVIMPMPLHNLLSFHYRQARLQNARALPQRIYCMSHNRRAIPLSIRWLLRQYASTRQQHSNDANPQRIPVSHNRDSALRYRRYLSRLQYGHTDRD